MIDEPSTDADSRCVISALQSWLADQPLSTRLVVNAVFVAITFWVASATGSFALLLGALVIAVFAFNLDDVRRARRWLKR